MLRIRQIFGAASLCLLMAMAAVASNFHQYGYHQTKWRRWPSFAPQTSPADQPSPLRDIDLPKAGREDKTLPPPRDSIRDTSDDPLHKPDAGADLSGQLIPDESPSPEPPATLPKDAPAKPADDAPPKENPVLEDPPKDPFEDDGPAQGDKPAADKPAADKPAGDLEPDALLPVDPPADDTSSIRLPRRIVSRVSQTAALPGVGPIAQTRVQYAAIPQVDPLDDSLDDAAPRPQLLSAIGAAPAVVAPVDSHLINPVTLRTERQIPPRTAPAQIARRSDFALPAVAFGKPAVAPGKIAKPSSVQTEAPRQPAAGPTNPLRLRRTSGQSPVVTSGAPRPSYQPPTPQRRNPLR